MKTYRFKDTVAPFGRAEHAIEFPDAKHQAYFEMVSGSLKKLVAFLDDDGEEVLTKELPCSAFIKPYAPAAKIYLINVTEKPREVHYRLVLGVRMV